MASPKPAPMRSARRPAAASCQGRPSRPAEPRVAILIVAGLVSGVSGDWAGFVVILGVVGVSVAMDVMQEERAEEAAARRRESVAVRARVRRDGGFVTVPVEQVVPGDILRVRAGDIVPADALVIESAAFTAAEAALTGEPYSVEKRAGPVTAAEPAGASNALFRGAVALTGEATALVVATGPRHDVRRGGLGARRGPGPLAVPARSARLRPGRRAADPRPGGRRAGSPASSSAGRCWTRSCSPSRSRSA